MARIDPIAGDDLAGEARFVADRVVETRGEITRPFQLLLHAPRLAAPVAELGHLVRTASSLAATDRELVILATGRATGCSFVWDSHLGEAAKVGIAEEVIATLRRDPAALDDRERALASFVEELCETRAVTDATFEAARTLLGDRGVVELSLTIGYYVMLASVMGACDAC